MATLADFPNLYWQRSKTQQPNEALKRKRNRRLTQAYASGHFGQNIQRGQDAGGAINPMRWQPFLLRTGSKWDREEPV